MNAFLPNHPAFVHFPIALLSVAFLCEVLALGGRRPALSEWARIALYLGTLGALAAAGTGLWGEPLTEGKPDSIERLSELHKNLALIVTGLAVVMSVWRMIMPKNPGAAARGILVLGLAIIAALTLYSGHLGGQMVYDHGVGVTIGKRSFGAKGLPEESWPGHQAREEEGRDRDHDRPAESGR